MAEPDSPPREKFWLIYKRSRAGFYRAASRGYTDSITHAGRYTKNQAEKECRVEPEQIFMVPAP